MANVILLLKLHLMNSFGINKAFHSKSKPKFVLMCLLGVLLVAAVLAVSFSYSFIITSGIPQEEIYIVPCMMMCVSSIIVLFTTIYKSGTLLFGFADYDMIVSMPIKIRQVVAARVLILYFMNIAFSLVIMVPAGVVYALFTYTESLFWLYYVIAILFVPVVPIIIATIIGAIVAAVASRFRKKNAITTIMLFVVFIAWMFISMSAGAGDTYSQVSASVVYAMQNAYPLMALFKDAILGNAASLAVFVLISIAAFAVYCVVISKFFTKLNTRFKSQSAKGNYKLGEQKTSTPMRALIRREAKVFFGTPMYVFNFGFGYVMSIILCIISLFVVEDIKLIMNFPEIKELITLALPFALSILIVMSSTTAASISLEGKQIWIVKSLPVHEKTVLLAKAAFNLVLSVPTILICSTIVCIVFELGAADAVMIYAIPLTYAVLSALFGLLVNLKMPMLSWKTPAQPIKQSASTMITVFGGMIMGVVPAVLAYMVSRSIMYAVPVAIIIVDILLYWILANKGAKMFREL